MLHQQRTCCSILGLSLPSSFLYYWMSLWTSRTSDAVPVEDLLLAPWPQPPKAYAVLPDVLVDEQDRRRCTGRVLAARSWASAS